MRVFGITGGSGVGKTTVSDIFRSNGVFVADADKAAREVVKNGSECLDELTQHFGKGILTQDGTLNRKKLGSVVFSDKDELEKLNEITHKYIKMYIEHQLENTACELAAIDGAVLIGSNIGKMCKFIVSVIADRDIRIRRIMMRDKIDCESAVKRLNSQPDDDFYKRHSRYVIYNNMELDFLKQQTEKILNSIRKTRYND